MNLGEVAAAVIENKKKNPPSGPISVTLRKMQNELVMLSCLPFASIRTSAIAS